jgi:hypothetical protein
LERQNKVARAAGLPPDVHNATPWPEETSHGIGRLVPWTDVFMGNVSSLAFRESWMATQYINLRSMTNFTDVCKTLDRLAASAGVGSVLSALDLVFIDSLIAAGAAEFLTAERAARAAPPHACRLVKEQASRATFSNLHAVTSYLGASKHLFGQCVLTRSKKRLAFADRAAQTMHVRLLCAHRWAAARLHGHGSLREVLSPFRDGVSS